MIKESLLANILAKGISWPQQSFSLRESLDRRLNHQRSSVSYLQLHHLPWIMWLPLLPTSEVCIFSLKSAIDKEWVGVWQGKVCGTASKYRPGSIKDFLVKPLRIWKQVWAWIIIIYQPSIYLQRRGLEYIEPDVLWEYESKCGRGSIKDFLVNPLCVAPPSFSAPASIQADLWVLEHASRCPSQYIWHNSDFIWNL